MRRDWRLAGRLRRGVEALRRPASAAFNIRIISAGIAYLSQIILARWLGAAEFGVYAYVWTWVLLIGTAADCGFATAAQSFLPRYVERRRFRFVAGFLRASRWAPLGLVSVFAALAALFVWHWGHFLLDSGLTPLFLACLLLPAYGMTAAQDGVGRAMGRIWLALIPPYLLRPILLLAFMLGAIALGLPSTAGTAMLAAVLSTWLTAAVQMVMIDRAARSDYPVVRPAYAFRPWFAKAMPILLLNSFFFLLNYIDILLLQHFRPSAEVGVYFAAGKGMALVSMIYFALSSTATREFSRLDEIGDRAGLEAFYAKAVRWMFWSSLATLIVLLALGLPFLWLFGPEFMAGYPLMFVMAIGVLLRASIGPAEQLLAMLGQLRVCTAIYATAFAINAALCLILIPRMGAMGAAVSVAIAIFVETVLLVWAARVRLNMHIFIGSQLLRSPAKHGIDAK